MKKLFTFQIMIANMIRDTMLKNSLNIITKYKYLFIKLWQFFNTDTSMSTGHFKFGDVESGATMLLKAII